MTPIDALGRLARGERPKDALLPPCRLEGMGAAAYGEEAVVNHFRQAPFGGLEDARAVVSAGHVGLFTTDAAMMADTYDGRILRIWRLGPGEPIPAEPAMGVAFDTDLYQARRDVAMRAEDHPQLAPAAAETVRRIGERIAHDWTPADGPPPWRTRPFLLRAFSGDGAGAALFAVHRLGPEEQRTTGFAFAAARFQTGSDAGVALIVRDLAGEKAVERLVWRTRVA